MRFSSALSIALFLYGSAVGAVVGVPGDYTSIQEAVDAAQIGDTILVEPGTYVENLDLKGKGLTLISSAGAKRTVIDGEQNGVTVKFSFPLGSDTTLDGFTITNGSGFYSGGEIRGGGIYMEGVMSPLIINCIITGNTAEHGGGIYCSYASPFIRNNVISENIGLKGCGIYCDAGAEPHIENNRIVSNIETAWKSYGGGVYCAPGSLSRIEGNWIEDNETYCGGGICCEENATSMIVNNIFRLNSAGRGGGLYSGYGSEATVMNCTFYKNDADYGGGACTFSNGEIYILNSIFWLNTDEELHGFNTGYEPVVEYSCIKGGWPGEGNISLNPRFVDADAGDLHILFISPCRNNGTSAGAALPAIDFEGDPRPAFGTIDIGADEFHTHLYHVGESTAGQTVELKVTALPTTSPVGIWFSGGLLVDPLPSKWGDWYLEMPVLGPMLLGAVPAPEGVAVLPIEVPHLPEPTSVYMQAMAGEVLTNWHRVDIE